MLQSVLKLYLRKNFVLKKIIVIMTKKYCLKLYSKIARGVARDHILLNAINTVAFKMT